jgi:hypothetical protein
MSQWLMLSEIFRIAISSIKSWMRVRNQIHADMAFRSLVRMQEKMFTAQP